MWPSFFSQGMKPYRMGVIKVFQCLRRFAKDFTDLQALSLTQKVIRDFPSTPQTMGAYQYKLCCWLFLPQSKRWAYFYKLADEFLSSQQTCWKLTGTTENLSTFPCHWISSRGTCLPGRSSHCQKALEEPSESGMQDSTCVQSHQLCLHTLTV